MIIIVVVTIIIITSYLLSRLVSSLFCLIPVSRARLVLFSSLRDLFLYLPLRTTQRYSFSTHQNQKKTIQKILQNQFIN